MPNSAGSAPSECCSNDALNERICSKPGGSFEKLTSWMTKLPVSVLEPRF